MTSARVSIIRFLALLSLCITVLLMPPASFAEEGKIAPSFMSSEKLKEVWTAEAKCAAHALKLTGDDASLIVKAYVSARQEHHQKLHSLSRTREAIQKRREFAEKARSNLKEAFARIIGPKKTEKALALLDPFAPSSFLLDRMVGEMISLQLTDEKLDKALLRVMEHNADLAAAMSEARKARSWEGFREKVNALTESLNKELAKILTEEQMAAWKQKYTPPIFGRPRPRQ
jgi:hypothetical protein